VTSMMPRVLLTLALAAGTVATLVLSTPLLAVQSGRATYTPVTGQRLIEPEPHNWLMYRRTYNGWGYSPLDRITPDNVANLEPVWSFSTGVQQGHEAPPIVNDGIMFVTTPQNQAFALDAATGDLRWRYVREFPEDLVQFHQTNRGVALYDDKVFFGTADAFVVALDARSGDVVWERKVADHRLGYYITMAPLVADGKVMIGTSGGERGIRGFVTALDPATGATLWKTYTIPEPGEPGSDTWPGDSWRTGGAPVWVTGTYDPELNTRLLYVPANENLCTDMEGLEVAYEPGRPFTGARSQLIIREGADHLGELQAWNVDSGEKAWSQTFESQNWGPVLTTGGGLVFMGGTNDRYFRAFDAATGARLWQIRTNSGVIGVPSSFAVGGTQYIAVQSGWGVDAERMQNGLDRFRQERTHIPQGGVIWVFALNEGR